MIRAFKNSIKNMLERHNYLFTYIPPNEIAGHNFVRDIKLLVGCEDPACFDVGANEGQTVKFFQHVFKRPRIYAFEPSVASFRKLQAQHSSAQVSLHNFALGAQNTRQEFVIYEHPCLNSFLRLDPAPENRFRNRQTIGSELVEVRTIDSFVRQNDINKIDLLKIDTQGFDLQVLLGAADSFQQGLIDNVFIELNFVRMYENQGAAHLIAEFLAGYNLYLVDYYEKMRQQHTLAWCNALFTRR